MIERHWKGLAKRDRAKDYITHLKKETFKQLATIDGFIAAKILKRDIKEGIEFLIITEWKNMNSIKAFAGSAVEKAVVPQLVQDMMLSCDDDVRHYKVHF